MTDDKILWLDLETTGVGDDAQILEIGLAVSEGLDEVVATWSAGVRPAGFNPYDLEPEVFSMHLESGLLQRLYHDSSTIERAVDAAMRFIRDNFGISAYDVTVGGSGIDRFDLPLMRRHQIWGRLPERFHWRTLDVSSTKSLLKRAGIEPVSGNVGHRALDDAIWAFRVAQQAVQAFDIAAERMQPPVTSGVVFS